MKEDCIGCGACVNICVKGCISMTQDEEGFFKPEIDQEKCINCNRCIEVCPLVESNPKNKMLASYFFVNKDSYDRNLSSSGGFFKALADMVFEMGGVVFGAAINDDFMVEHKMITCQDEMYQIMGSKYVQSDIGSTLKEVKGCLEKEQWVLFSGTPCQIAGLKKYLGDKEYEKLITLDIFCHGVPSPGVWEKYLQEIHGNQEIRYIQFRYKAEGWWEYGFRIQYAHSDYCRRYRGEEKDSYLSAFLSNRSINKNCYNCKFRTKEKYSDFFIGDAWNVNKVRKNMDDDRGITTVVVNSEKGVQILNKLKQKHHCFSISLEEAVYQRRELFEGKKIPEERKAFFEDFRKGICFATDRCK